MPGLDKTGPQGSGQPGRGFGPCGNYSYHRPAQQHSQGMGRRQMRRLFCGTAEIHGEQIYDFTVEELISRKQALHKELQWLDDRIKELGEQNEISPSGN